MDFYRCGVNYYLLGERDYSTKLPWNCETALFLKRKKSKSWQHLQHVSLIPVVCSVAERSEVNNFVFTHRAPERPYNPAAP